MIAKRCLLLLCGSLLFVTGCLELDIHVKLNEDGSAIVTEKLGFSQAALDLAATSQKDQGLLEKALTQEGALQRMARMGRGVQLVRHAVADEVRADVPFKTSTAVYRIADINDLRLSPPFPNLWRDETARMTFLLEPCFKRTVSKRGGGGTDLPGYMALEYRFASSRPDGKVQASQPESLPPLSPAQAQGIRGLLPVVRELTRSGSVKVTLEAYSTLCDGWWESIGAHHIQDRDRTRSVPYIELLNLSGQNRDAFDRPLLADEEMLIEFVRGDWNGPHIRKLLLNLPRTWECRFWYDSRIPLIYMNVPAYAVHRYIFLPSVVHYKRYFEGKTFDDGFAPAPPKQ